MDSDQTRAARASLRGAEQFWREHKQHCGLCGAVARARSWDRLCPAGTAARNALRAAACALDHNRRLDMQPPPEQLCLF